ncbi:unnamed protein product [Arabidopsis thaliana]|uniref:Uncharacterized protein n=1 Tax=Arabidopsis thaliana TaxID=3702 RepID=A0A5S9SNQ8_ARATH|nr:unnamed protein product [Arabidopsis thaliana]
MEEFSSSEIIYDDVIQRLFCDDVTQRLFWMMSYKGYFGICFEYREQRTTVKIREITERRRLGEVSDQEKSPRYIKFQYDFRLDLQNDRKTNRTLNPVT